VARRLFHIISAAAWVEANEDGRYAPESLTTEGFIHLSEKDQILRPANLLYRGRTDLSLLVLDTDRLRSPVRYERGSHGEVESFPHLYGELNLDGVVDVVAFAPRADGTFDLPAALEA